MKTYTPHYMDSGHYMAHTPYMQLSRKGSGIVFISNVLTAISAYEKFIDDYPYIKCEPLEFLYQTHRSVCAMDKYLYEDLVRHCWRSISWAAWIALVTPFPKKYMLKMLVKHTDERLVEQWSVRGAIDRLKRQSADDPLFIKAQEFESYLSRLPCEKIPLRKTNINALFSEHNRLKEHLTKVYKENGTNSAISYLRLREQGEMEVGYEEWFKTKKLNKANHIRPQKTRAGLAAARLCWRR